MKLKQLSLFLENKPGHVRNACRVLADAGINIETMSLADTEQFGILRLIVRDYEKAIEVFRKHDIIVKVTDVVAVVVENRPGGLADILDVLDAAKLNIEYMYGFHFQKDAKSVLVFRFDEPDLALEKLQEKGLQTIGNNEIFG
ncbi:MAG: hypothetical protein ACRC10_01865 [Thermoguttaceae bacterium]